MLRGLLLNAYPVLVYERRLPDERNAEACKNEWNECDDNTKRLYHPIIKYRLLQATYKESPKYETNGEHDD